MRFAEWRIAWRQRARLGSDADRVPADPCTLVEQVVALPIVGDIPYPLVFAAIVWSVFGTVVLALVGIKLPGLDFKNQTVEAAYRKELVYGEDDADRAAPPTVIELFGDVRKNYFRPVFALHVFQCRVAFLPAGRQCVRHLLLVPTFAAGAITFGFFQQIADRLRSGVEFVPVSGQFLVDDRRADVDLQALAAFESASTICRSTRSRRRLFIPPSPDAVQSGFGRRRQWLCSFLAWCSFSEFTRCA